MDFKKYKLIKKEYEKYYKRILSNSQTIVRSTTHGIWGTYAADVYFQLFKSLKLKNYNNFLDLGSGDGKVVLIASLFTKSLGIEIDKELCQVGLDIKQKLSIDSKDCKIIFGDFMNHNLSSYDIILINPDKGFHEFEEKLIKEMKGILVVCNNIFLPRFLKKEKVVWVDQIPFYVYINDET